jgi:hypothetical protein
LGRQQRHLSFIAEFSPTIRHIAGQSNVVADTLSRPASGQSEAVSLSPPRQLPGGGKFRRHPTGATCCPTRCECSFPFWWLQGGG